MLRERVGQAELDRRLRQEGIFNVGDVDLALLEPDGQISVRRVDEAKHPLDTTPPDEARREIDGDV